MARQLLSRSRRVPPTPLHRPRRFRSKRSLLTVFRDPLGDREIRMSTGATPPDNPQYVADQYDEIRWGQSRSGNVPAGGRDDYADRAGLPRLPESADGVEHIYTAHDAARRRWHPPTPTHGQRRGQRVRSGPPRHPTAVVPRHDGPDIRFSGDGDRPASPAAASGELAALDAGTGTRRKRGKSRFRSDAGNRFQFTFQIPGQETGDRVFASFCGPRFPPPRRVLKISVSPRLAVPVPTGLGRFFCFPSRRGGRVCYMTVVVTLASVPSWLTAGSLNAHGRPADCASDLG